MTTTLRLSLKKQYFDEIKSGKKQYEYRLMTPYWAKRLMNKNYDTIVLTLGYPPKFDADRHLTLPYKGYMTTTIIHPHFGDKPVRVYAIDVSGGLYE